MADNYKKPLKGGLFLFIFTAEPLSTQRGGAATKQAFNPQISQITQILKIINKNNS